MDVFVEYMVKKKFNRKDIILQLLVVVSSLLIFFICIGFIPSIGYILASGVVFGTYYLLTSFNVEFEYILTNGELDIDKIIYKRKRRRLISIHLKDIKSFSAFNSEIPEIKNNTDDKKVIYACSSLKDSDVYYMKVEHKSLGNIIIVFNPNEKILSEIKKFAPRSFLNV